MENFNQNHWMCLTAIEMEAVMKESTLVQLDNWMQTATLNDLERVGFIRRIHKNSLLVSLTLKGIDAALRLRCHRIQGGSFDTFHIDEKTFVGYEDIVG